MSDKKFINSFQIHCISTNRAPKAVPIRSREGDEMDLVTNEQQPGQSTPPLMESEEESDTDSIPDLSAEQGLRFHLRKKGEKLLCKFQCSLVKR